MGHKEILEKKLNAAKNTTSHPFQIEGDIWTWPLAFKGFYREPDPECRNQRSKFGHLNLKQWCGKTSVYLLPSHQLSSCSFLSELINSLEMQQTWKGWALWSLEPRALNGRGTIPALRASFPGLFGIFHLLNMAQNSTADINQGKLQCFHHWFKFVWKSLKWWHIEFGKLGLSTSAERQNVLEIIDNSDNYWQLLVNLVSLFFINQVVEGFNCLIKICGRL